MKHIKTILFGGSFDPIHNGHLRVGRAVLEELAADQMIFVPARRSPHKSHIPAGGHHRLAMIQRAITGSDKFSVSDCELNRGEPSYTLDTIYFFRKELGPEVDLTWLMGADQLADFDEWYRVEELLDICRVSVMYRAGYPKPDFDCFRGVFRPDQITRLEQGVVETPLIEVSSTEIRRQLAAGELCRDVLPESVIRYIQSHHLYGSPR